jgi:23S rRNA (uracil1939-C5)-methyltransferase
LARDLRLLIDHGYHIDSITALDMFPQTFHVETVVRLKIE